MFKFVLLVAVFGLAVARPQAEKDADILRNENDDSNLQNGDFRYAYETSNSIAAVAQGRLKNAEASNPDDRLLEVRGCYSYISPDGSPVVVVYVANELGFQPEFTSLSACPDLSTYSGNQGLRSPAARPAPAPVRQAPRPSPPRAPAPAPAPVRSPPAPAPIDDEKFYKVLNERGEVVAVIPKAQALQSLPI